ncbi:hypothetical protein [Agromyces mediolanus]|uniref:hypothetical protein n=1 Tax=Agromyces mediolanus TaxID=41986 RepID=UPI001E3492F8|nr:hypothetical protein [Agromyces mediolanus]MCD1569905.1 hypothetical protein [Agromyces mediolanus]
MTELAYMTLPDWGQHGAAMVPQSARIREWLGAAPFLFATASQKQYNDASLDRTIVEHIAPTAADRTVVEIQRLHELVRDDSVISHPITVLRPFDEADCDLIAELAHGARLQKAFVIVHHESHPIRVWLDAMGATNLHSGTSVAPITPVLREAAESIKAEDYNGLSSGRGKDAVVQLVRAFAPHGYPADPALWMRAYLSVGGSFRHAAQISKLVTEVQRGVRHRVKPQYRDDIYDILLARSQEDDAA